ncbi:MAG: hypothetical protein AAF998_02765 [Bacteroidota bacterium]
MSGLLDSYARLHKFKQGHGLNRGVPEKASAYVLEARLLRILESGISRDNIRAVAADCGMTKHQLEDLTEAKVYRLGLSALRGTLSAYQSGGIVAAIQYLENA